MVQDNHSGAAEQATWCILRTSGGRTLPLATSLAKAGFEAWTPVEVRKRRVRAGRAPVDVDAPMMPTFVFARTDRLHDLRRIIADPRSPHPPFSIFRYLGTVPGVSDLEMQRLRTAERREVPKKRARTFGVGADVRVPEGAFGGMSGVVQHSDARFTLVAFGGRVEVKIATFLLIDDAVQDGNTGDGNAARAA